MASEARPDDIRDLTTLRTLRDEIKLQLHLAGMEAKARWNLLEPKLFEVEKAAQETKVVTRQLAKDLIKELETFRDTLKREVKDVRAQVASKRQRRSETKSPGPNAASKS